MRVSVVINTFNRAASLRQTLDALRHQTYADFEVVVVDGPSDDGTQALLAERAGAVRSVRFEERNLSVSRNLGIDAAAGEVVAFIDDDAIPEARWLEDLVAAYGNGVGGAGGLVLDASGTRVQYRYSVCDRAGRTDYDQPEPLDRFVAPGADPFLYLQGTNASFLREALAAVEGFDEEIEYNYDESEVCSRVIDAGWRLVALDGAVVHHKVLASHMRRGLGGFTDPFFQIKNRVYFGLRAGAEHRSVADRLTAATGELEHVKGLAVEAAGRGGYTEAELDHFLRRADEGFAVGFERGMAGRRKGRAIAPPQPDAFLPYPVLVPAGRRMAVAFVSRDYPPRPVGGVARLTQDLARACAREGHEAHVVTRDDDGPYRLDFEDGVWVHRFPVARRFLPELGEDPVRPLLEHLAAVDGAVARVAERIPLDAVSGALWTAEPLLCALDPSRRTSVTCVTSMATVAELQPETAAAPLTPRQTALETALLRTPAQLLAISADIAAACEATAGRPVAVAWPGVEDRRDAHPRTRPADDQAVEILFVGRLEPRKGVDTLLEAAADLLRDHPAARLRICGADNPEANGGPGVHAAWVAQHAADVADRVSFAGAVSEEELFAAYADADVFCGPSRYESFGLVHVEAMMMGLPVVAGDAGGMRETVVDGVTGALVAPGDAAALRAALDPLVADGDHRRRQGEAGRARFEEHFSAAAGRDRALALLDAVPAPPAARQRDAVSRALAEACELDEGAAAAVADTLLDRDRFPYDPEVGLRAAMNAPDDASFVDAAFTAVLGRPADPAGRATYIQRLAEESRYDAVASIVRSDEAKIRGIAPAVADRLPTIAAEGLGRELVTLALTDDDATFVAGLDRLLHDERATDAQRSEWVGRLEAGTSRTALARELLTSSLALHRIIEPERAVAGGLHSVSAMATELDALTGAAFVKAAYRLFLDREADPDGAYNYEVMLAEGADRGAVLREIATSQEAANRGITTEGAQAVIAALGTAPAAGPAPAPAPTDDEPPVLDRLRGRAARLRDQVRPATAPEAEAGPARWARDLQDELGGLRAQLDVMARKHEALAMDMRDKLPPTAPHSAPEPEVLDADRFRAHLSARVLRVNVGCGEKPLPGYVNVDARPLRGVDVVADAIRMPFAPGSVDELASHHLIEHFREHYVGAVLLPYWRSLLRPSGILRVVTPNWAVLIEHLDEGRISFEQFKLVTFGLQDYAGDDHFALYSPETLRRLLETAGFHAIELVEERRQNGLSPEIEIVARPGRDR